jgi:hypothetical protein
MQTKAADDAGAACIADQENWVGATRDAMSAYCREAAKVTLRAMTYAALLSRLLT